MQTPWDVGVDVAKESVVVACAGGQFAPPTVTDKRAALRAPRVAGDSPVG